MKQYVQLLKDISETGTKKAPAREGMPGTLSLFGYQIRVDLSKGFPLLTTRKLSFRNIVVELLWFLRGDTNVKYLNDYKCYIWNQDAYNYYVKIASANTGKEANAIYRDNGDDTLSMFSFEEFVDIIKVTKREDLPKYNGYTLGDCGYQYGKVWRNWDKYTILPIQEDLNNVKLVGSNKIIDQIANVIESLGTNPEGRRHIVSAVDPAHDKELALYWCHSLFQFNCRKLTAIQREDYYAKINNYNDEQRSEMNPNCSDEDVHIIMDEEGIPKYYLDCSLYQRSADTPLGVPYNIASYALLTEIIAKIHNYIPGDYIHSFGDVHIYENQLEQINEQISRECRGLPKLDIKLHMKNFKMEQINWWLPTDFELEGYNPHPKIDYELSTGMVAVK